MSKEWDQANLKTLACRVRTEEAEAFREYARERGLTAHALLADYVRAVLAMKRNMSVSAADLIRGLTADKATLEQQMADKDAEIADLRDLAKRLDERATRAEKIVHDYVLAK